jgi:hypothetical protein
MDVRIEVTATPEMSSTERGRLLENFGRKLLKCQNFKVTTEVRITGQEVDLLAEELTTGEKIIVECKAYRSTIAADVIHKLFGQVAFGDYASGWLISTYDLGKDAKGLRDAWSRKPPQERRRLQIYDPEQLVDRLVNAGLVVSPEKLSRLDGLLYGDEVTLLITPWGTFWATVVLDPQTRLRKSAYLYSGETGAPVVERGLIDQIQMTDSSLNELVWELPSHTPSSKPSRDLSGDLQNIVKVPMADDWADYRPARPKDFVGRDQLQRDVIDILDKVRFQQTETRLFAIKSPSGWGKSSFALKIAEQANSAKGRPYFVYAVDSRAAASRRFGELAIYSAVKAAMESGFISRVENLSMGGASAPFGSETAQQILSSLQGRNAVICLIFDQFEELLYKEELAIIFDEMRVLCDAIAESQANIVIGFSWKTDGTIPPEHKAYHLWHSLSDRRREFELAPLRPSEVGTALNRFSKELGQALSPQLRRTLNDHCQGYPWLLKKLCIHVLQQVRSGLEQSEILLTSLKIEELFNRDIQNLSSSEYSCIKQVATEAPAEFFKMAQTFGDDVVQNLLEKRLVIRSGARLSLYWDIFRDFILVGKVPYIPTTYVPQANIGTYLSALRALLHDDVRTYDGLAVKLKVSAGTADNIVRDLVMVGHAEANRSSGAINPIMKDDNEAAEVIVAFCRSHIIVSTILNTIGFGTNFSVEEFRAITRSTYPISTVSDSLVGYYSKRVLQWCVTAGIIEQQGSRLKLRANSGGVRGLTTAGAGRQGQNLFFGEAPPASARAALEAALVRGGDRAALEAEHGRNAVYVLMNLGLLDARGNALLPSGAQALPSLSDAAARAPTLVLAMDLIASTKDSVTGLQLGTLLAEQLGLKWSEGSKRRSGGALKRWAEWLASSREEVSAN